MPTIKDSLYFNYNGISCKTYNLMNVNVDNSSMLQEQFNASRTINETVVRGSDTPIFSDVSETPLEFTMNIAFESTWTQDDIDNVIVWLFQDNYKPLYFEDKPDRIYYCMPNGDASLYHNALSSGYVTITMRCKSSRLYSVQQLSSQYDMSSNYIADPITPATLSLKADASSTLVANNTYYVVYTWYNASGETSIGSYTIPNIAVATGGNDLLIGLPSMPTGVTGAKIYVGTSPTQLIYQGSTASTTYTISTQISTTNSTAPITNKTTDTLSVTLSNSGHLGIYPEISFVKVGTGNITFTKDGNIFEVDNIIDGENIYINCEREIVETDAVGIYHYDDVVGDFKDIILNRGDNTIQIDGNCKELQFRYTFKYRF